MGECPVEFNVSVVLPAGGSGERFGESMPKQYNLLMEQPLFLHTIMAFHRIKWIQHIVLVIHVSYTDYVQDVIHKHKLEKVLIVEGSTTRHRSIQAGVQSLQKVSDCPEVVIIHDVVRPFIDQGTLSNVASSAKLFGAAGVTRPLVSTVISGDQENKLVQSLDRSQYLASEMPQAFLFDVIKTAYGKADEHDLEYGTECLLLAMKHTGTRAKLIHGPESLWKVTYKKDLYAAEGILKEMHLRLRVKCHDGEGSLELIKHIEDMCNRRHIHVIQTNNGNESQQCNSFVFIYSDITNNGVSHNSECVLKNSSQKEDSGLPCSVMVRPCVVHVYLSDNQEMESQTKFTSGVLNVANAESSQLIIYGILCMNPYKYEHLAKMVASLVWNRDDTLCGQTFII